VSPRRLGDAWPLEESCAPEAPPRCHNRWMGEPRLWLCCRSGKPGLLARPQPRSSLSSSATYQGNRGPGRAAIQDEVLAEPPPYRCRGSPHGQPVSCAPGGTALRALGLLKPALSGRPFEPSDQRAEFARVCRHPRKYTTAPICRDERQHMPPSAWLDPLRLKCANLVVSRS
jgi:hypothetical protein